ncbi:MAG TPA: SsrA-binding protein SmpB [Longimicrobiales bacterium]|nr:SsrA-binding protein SmpB [Longimicrobiales bacterium]
MSNDEGGRKVVARNKKALHDFFIVESYEAGIVLTGPEVKSIRGGRASLAESYAAVEGGEVWLRDMHVSPYDPASRWNTDPVRPRKLLLNGKEIRKLIGASKEKGLTLVPLDLYISKGYVKLTLALARGKKMFDKRETLKRKVAEREIDRAVKNR